jgi:glycosyltransferase involved in cell wall biosynthesis
MGLVHLFAVFPFIVVSVLAIRRIIRRHQIQLVHSNTMTIIDGALAAWSLRIPHVWHAREILTNHTPHNFSLSAKVVMAIVLGLSDRVIAISQAVAHCFSGMTGAEKIRVIYNAVDIASFTQSDSRVRAEYRRLLGVPDDVPLVGQVANVTVAKSYTDFIRAIPLVRKKMPDVRFVGVGGMPHADYKAIVMQLINDLDLGNSLILTGFREDAPQIMAALDIVVLASRYEPLGRVLIEGMAAGKPVVGTDVGGIPEIIEDGVTGLIVPPASPERLAEAILEILKDPESAHQMGQAGRRRAQTLFNPVRYVRSVEMVYQDLLTPPARSRSPNDC